MNVASFGNMGSQPDFAAIYTSDAVEHKPYASKRSFLSLTAGPPVSLEILVTQTLSKTQFDFGTFLATPENRTFVCSAASGKVG